MTQDALDRADVRRLWRSYTEAVGAAGAPGVEGRLRGAFAFGGTPELADELAELVLTGPKRATTSLYLEFERDGEPLPEPGDHWVVLDGRQRPVCVIRTTDVQVTPLNQVDAGFAWDEGEGDRSLEFWLRVHRDCFRRSCEQLGVPFHDGLPAVLERFALVWPR